jgi:hypothetical protein
MASKSSASNGATGQPVVGFSHLWHLLSCDACGEKNPPNCCTRCLAAYYCSVTRQRAHWKQEQTGVCTSVVDKRAELKQSVDESKDPFLSKIKDRSMRKAIVLGERADLLLHGSASGKRVTTLHSGNLRRLWIAIQNMHLRLL